MLPLCFPCPIKSIFSNTTNYDIQSHDYTSDAKMNKHNILGAAAINKDQTSMNNNLSCFCLMYQLTADYSQTLILC